MTTPAQRRGVAGAGRAWLATLVRLALLGAVLVAVNLLVGMLLARFMDPLAKAGFMLNLTLVLLLLAYVLLLAIPFVPGVEIGVSLLIAQGAVAAPFVYLATLAGLALAYGIGVLLSGSISCKLLISLGMPRACGFVEEIRLLDRPQRLARMQQALPRWASRWFLGHRMLVLAAILNLPGNSLIGGGGGIALLAGLSRMFTAAQFFLTITLATLPVPLLVYFFGGGLLQ